MTYKSQYGKKTKHRGMTDNNKSEMHLLCVENTFVHKPQRYLLPAIVLPRDKVFAILMFLTGRFI